MNRKSSAFVVLVILTLSLSGCAQSNFSSEESAFLKRCPEINLAKIPQAHREVFMDSYEEFRPVLDGRDECMLSTEQEIASIRNEGKLTVEVIGDDVRLPNGLTLTPIRIKNGGSALHKQIVRNYGQSFIVSFLDSSGN